MFVINIVNKSPNKSAPSEKLHIHSTVRLPAIICHQRGHASVRARTFLWNANLKWYSACNRVKGLLDKWNVWNQEVWQTFWEVFSFIQRLKDLKGWIPCRSLHLIDKNMQPIAHQPLTTLRKKNDQRLHPHPQCGQRSNRTSHSNVKKVQNRFSASNGNGSETLDPNNSSKLMVILYVIVVFILYIYIYTHMIIHGLFLWPIYIYKGSHMFNPIKMTSCDVVPWAHWCQKMVPDHSQLHSLCTASHDGTHDVHAQPRKASCKLTQMWKTQWKPTICLQFP